MDIWVPCNNNAGYKCNACLFKIKNKEASKFLYCPMCGDPKEAVKPYIPAVSPHHQITFEDVDINIFGFVRNARGIDIITALTIPRRVQHRARSKENQKVL